MIQKGSDEFKMWADIYTYKAKFTPPKNDNAFFQELVTEGHLLEAKYKTNKHLHGLLTDVICAIWNQLEREAQYEALQA